MFLSETAIDAFKFTYASKLYDYGKTKEEIENLQENISFETLPEAENETIQKIEIETDSVYKISRYQSFIFFSLSECYFFVKFRCTGSWGSAS